jgi:hypothetical protein
MNIANETTSIISHFDGMMKGKVCSVNTIESAKKWRSSGEVEIIAMYFTSEKQQKSG